MYMLLVAAGVAVSRCDGKQDTAHVKNIGSSFGVMATCLKFRCFNST